MRFDQYTGERRSIVNHWITAGPNSFGIALVCAENGSGPLPAEANARAIAAAPELLEALKQAIEQLRDVEPTPLDGISALIRKLDAAVAKAEGR